MKRQPKETRDLLVADAGPLIALAKCGQLELLEQLFERVHVPQAVVDEVLMGGHWPEMPFLKTYLQTEAQVHASLDNPLVQQLRGYLHEGETQAIALANELPATLLIDELQGRRVAQERSIIVVGALGVLLRAKRLGLIERLKPCIVRMRSNGYALSEGLIAQVLQLAGES